MIAGGRPFTYTSIQMYRDLQSAIWAPDSLFGRTVKLHCDYIIGAACSYSYGSLMWGSRILSWIVLTLLGRRLMILMKFDSSSSALAAS